MNARPGLNIQLANRRGLRSRLNAIDGIESPHETPDQRVEWSCAAFGEPSEMVTRTPG